MDKRRRKLDHPITVSLENGRTGAVHEGPRFGRVLVAFSDGGAAGRPPESYIPLDDLTEASRLAIWNSKCHYIDE